MGKLLFESGSFDIVLSLNGFHAFPDKEAAYAETFRVLKKGGIFCGCFYVKGENRRTDWFVDELYTLKGFFTPPYATAQSLKQRLAQMYVQVELEAVEAMACFTCKKDKIISARPGKKGEIPMRIEVMQGVLLPFLGTTLGAACALFMRKELDQAVQRALTGFAAGVMVAASVWSLLIPAMEQAEGMGVWAFIPAVAGFWLGILFLLVLDRAIPHLHQGSDEPEGPRVALKRTTMLVLAVTLHNIPEGMAVGAVLAGWMEGSEAITMAGALTLALGIAIQNFPEGAIISMPLRSEGVDKGRAFLWGALSGAVEPIAALLTIWAAHFVVPVLPYLLSFAAGAMVYVVVEELIPEMSQGHHSNLGTLFFALGFTLMLTLDVALG